MVGLLDFLRHAPLPILAALMVGENGLILLGAVAFGEWLTRRFGTRPVVDTAAPLDARQILLAGSTVVLNALVTFVGLLLWRADIITVRTNIDVSSVLRDFLVLVITMDACMYVLHRVAHLPVFFRLIHRTHHRYDSPRPLTLFVLNPLEALSFGLLWLALLCCYEATWTGMALYLGFNVLFGVVGHIGVEPLPDRGKRLPVLRYVSTSSFHAGHHQDEGHNFGFYTLIWDRVFGTLAPRYEDDFGRPPLRRS
jgi:sterol desaturase/sphingolipid hydroxylase (fatty acid hydroxylase superfamily)